MKISKEPWQLMVEIRLSSRSFIVLICDNVIVLII